MPFSEICNEKLGTQGNRGIRKVDRLVREEVGEALHYDNIVDVEDIDDMVADVLGITDDSIAELAKARVRLVIAHLLETIHHREREYAERLIVGEIPSYCEARRKYNRLNR